MIPMSPWGVDHIFTCLSDWQVVGVWPLRIPGNATAVGGSSARSPERCPAGHSRRGGALRPSIGGRGEPLEVMALGGEQWVLLEERHDHASEIATALDAVAMQRVAMIVMPAVLDDRSTAEEAHEELQGGVRGCGLRDAELVLNLPAESARRVTHHTDREAAFAVNEPDDPLRETWPFLLIVRTERIVTGQLSLPRLRFSEPKHVGATSDRVPSDARSFQHIANC